MWGCLDAMSGMGGWMAGMAIIWVGFVLVLLAVVVAALVWLVQLIRRGAQTRAIPEPSDAVWNWIVATRPLNFRVRRSPAA